jgi:hypothetical protein
MSETLLLWLFGIIAAGISTVAGAVYLQSQRLTRLETIFNFWIETIGNKAAQILHSPHDDLGLDKYLDKYINEHPTLVLADWIEIKIMCERAEKNIAIEPGRRLVAGFVAAGAMQKILLLNKNLPVLSELRPNPSTGQ